MTRAGRSRAGLFAVLMLLVALAGMTLVSAGAEHHRADAHQHAAEHAHPARPAADTAARADLAGAATPRAARSTDDHQHGAESPTVPSSRLRPAADLTIRGTMPAVSHAPAPVDVVGPDGGDRRDDQASNPILRV
jgi:hypothetical protein